VAQQYREEAIQIWRDLGLEDRINIPMGLEDQPFTPRWFSDIIDLRMGAVFSQSAKREQEENEQADEDG
jgi:hypothetical protein